ncbi:hypothetical protein HJC23_004971 [Cyclotella cryptica]|uniref:Major facilitator superfamily (MFS) profile domain-containing protein n=1 Tax=Cyclotella cryptica TaxID=29204 RepID=A0ABD3P9P8_9STRA|eukprot:CCRYP_016609-RA/>CCRYP_016609-RA protein AED:0.20 eAED:0.20 QI:2497/1/1/1/0.25/0.2/5/3319/495
MKSTHQHQHQHNDIHKDVNNGNDDETTSLLTKNHKHTLQLSNSISDINDNDNVVHNQESGQDDLRSTLASVAGNILEWYDFAIYGYFSDVIGTLFFPSSPNNDDNDNNTPSILSSLLVFGLAFFARPLGGLLLGYIGDTFRRKRALEVSLFLMAFPTFFMGCLPTYSTVGGWSAVWLVMVRWMQGLSVGGQQMTSLVFVVEGRARGEWGWYGSFAMMASCLGTLLGEVVGYLMRKHYTTDQLLRGYWRIPFLCGIFVSLAGYYIQHHVRDHDRIDSILMEKKHHIDPEKHRPLTPLELAWSRPLRGSLLCVTAAVFLWAGGFYILFVWLVIFMTDLVYPPIPYAFVINASCLFVTMVVLFPFAGWLSDVWGRKVVMTWGGVGVALLSPVAMDVISRGGGNLGGVVAAQMLLGVCLCLYASPMCAWMVESFPPEARLTSVAIGYNVALALAGGMSPSLATWLVMEYGVMAVGYLLSASAIVSLLGLHLAPKHDEYL